MDYDNDVSLSLFFNNASRVVQVGMRQNCLSQLFYNDGPVTSQITRSTVTQGALMIFTLAQKDKAHVGCELLRRTPLMSVMSHSSSVKMKQLEHV